MATKHIFGGLFLVLAMLCACQAACPANSPYLKLSHTHTRCREDRGKDMPLTTADIQAIVDKHNEVRAAVSPPAANMLKMVWDADLAETAAKRARFCAKDTREDYEHYEHRAEPKMPGVAIGQNRAKSSGFSGMMDAISNSLKTGWLDERGNFTYGEPPYYDITQYVQMITSMTRLIGCGMANCSDVDKTNKQYKVCNYAYSRFSEDEPYTKASTSCAACPGKCVNKLCDGCNADKADCAKWWKFSNPCRYPSVVTVCPNRCKLCG